MTTPVVLFFCLAFVVFRIHAYSTVNESTLRHNVLNGYDVRVRPYDVTDVFMTFVANALRGINVRTQTMTMSGWWLMRWHDSRLLWNPLHYNISEFHVFEDDVWTPSVVVYNSVDSLSAIDEDTIPIKVASSGDVEWSPPGIVTVSCTTDITYFPFDAQTCQLSLTTFGYTIQQIILKPEPMTTKFYTPHGEWKLLTTFTETSDDSRASYISFHFKFKRKPVFYCLNLIAPVLLCWILSVFIYLLPAHSGEKVGYGLTVLLAFVVLMTLVANSVPTTADHVSLLEVYIALVLVFCMVSVVHSIITVAVYCKGDSSSNSTSSCSDPVPEWLRRFTLLRKNRLSPRGRRQRRGRGEEGRGGRKLPRRLDLVTVAPADSNGINSFGASHPRPVPPLSGHGEDFTSAAVVVQQPESAEGEEKGSDEAAMMITWFDVAEELDYFGLRVYLVLTSVISVGVMSVLIASVG